MSNFGLTPDRNDPATLSYNSTRYGPVRIGRTAVAIWRDAIERLGPFRTLANVGLEITFDRRRARETSSFYVRGIMQHAKGRLHNAHTSGKNSQRT